MPSTRALLPLVLLAVTGCRPMHEVARFDDDFAAARGQRRLLALVSPS
jgi:hypothetical protein